MSSIANITSGGSNVFLLCLLVEVFLQHGVLKWLLFRALILYVAAGALQEALATLRESQQPDTAAMFVLACREIHAEFISNLENSDDESDSHSLKDKLLKLPGLDPENEDVIAVCEYYGQYQRKLVHLCMDSLPYSD